MEGITNYCLAELLSESQQAAKQSQNEATQLRSKYGKVTLRNIYCTGVSGFVYLFIQLYSP